MAHEGAETRRRPQYRTDVSTLGADLIAGLMNALVYIQQGVTYALVVPVSPVHGLYTGVIAPVVGAVTGGSSCKEQLEATRTMAVIGVENVFATTVVLGESMAKVLAHAHAWTANAATTDQGQSAEVTP